MAEKIKSAFERFRELTKRVVAVPRAEIEKRESVYKHERKKVKQQPR